MNDFTNSNFLVLSIQQSDPDGYVMLYEQYSAVLYGVVYAILKDIQLAEHALAQTFTQICSNIHHYNPACSTFITWAMQVARSVSISHLQKPVPTLVLQAVAQPNPDGIQLMMMPAVGMPATGYDVLTLVMHGYTAAAISQQYNIPVEMVKAGVRKALRLKAIGA